MAKKKKSHEAVDEGWLVDVATTLKQSFSLPSSVVWRALLDGPAWTEWLPLDSVEWTSEEPFGVGTTRTVCIGNDVIDEVFFAWEDQKQMAFRFDASTLPLSAAVEDYRLQDTETGCDLLWTFRVRAIFPIGWILRAKLKSTLKTGLPKLEALINAHPDRFGA